MTIPAGGNYEPSTPVDDTSMERILYPTPAYEPDVAGARVAREPAAAAPAAFGDSDEFHAAIAMVGPPSGGKTAILQALLKGSPDPDTHGDWRILTDVDAELAEPLIDRLEVGRFPDATTVARSERWTVLGHWPDRQQRRPLWRGRGTDRIAGAQEEFDLQLLDLPGGATADPIRSGAAEYLRSADGIILVIDPIRMMEDTVGEIAGTGSDGPPLSTYSHLSKLLRALDGDLRGTGRTKLGQRLSVCVSKLDRQEVYTRARALGVLDREDGRAPVVPSGDAAAALFNDLCARSVDANDADIPQLLRTRFAYVDYHVVSAIGFYIKPGGVFNEDDFLNTYTMNKVEYVRKWQPLGVWEALLDLYESIQVVPR